MKFELTRTSVYGDAKPHDRAYSEMTPIVDHRNFKTPEEHDAKLNPPWLSRGTNHRLINGTIARDVGMKVGWFIEINNLEDLLAFQEECGYELVLSGDEIEIYDNYRE